MKFITKCHNRIMIIEDGNVFDAPAYHADRQDFDLSIVLQIIINQIVRRTPKLCNLSLLGSCQMTTS